MAALFVPSVLATQPHSYEYVPGGVTPTAQPGRDGARLSERRRIAEIDPIEMGIMNLGASWPPSTILVAVGLNHAASGLVERAVTLAALLDARLVVAHAVCTEGVDLPEARSLLEDLDVLDAFGRHHVMHWVTQAARAGVDVSGVIHKGPRARVIPEAARSTRAGLVVMGRQTRRRVLKAMPGQLYGMLARLPDCGVLGLAVD